jgi:hypothetical protein
MNNEERERVNNDLQENERKLNDIEKFFQYYLYIKAINTEEEVHTFALLSSQIFGIDLMEIKSIIKDIKANKSIAHKKFTKEELKLYIDHADNVKTLQTAAIINKNFDGLVSAKRVGNFQILVEYEENKITGEDIIYGLEALQVFFPINKFEVKVHKKGDDPTKYKSFERI